jgi:hypothetical protein
VCQYHFWCPHCPPPFPPFPPLSPPLPHPNSGITTLQTQVTTSYGTLAGRVASRKYNGFSST